MGSGSVLCGARRDHPGDKSDPCVSRHGVGGFAVTLAIALVAVIWVT